MLRRVLLPCALALAAVAARAATVVPLDVGATLNADVILNDGTGTLDPTQDPVDLGVLESDNFCFPTVSAATRLAAFTPDGVPDDAFFPADAWHPDVRLAWRNSDDGLNARRLGPTPEGFSVPVPPASYSEVHLFATAGDGSADLTVVLNYDDATTTVASFLVPDWFDDPFPTADVYFLIDGRDRVQVGSGPGLPFAYENRDDAAIFGFRVLADPARTLQSVFLERTDATGTFVFFGGVAVQAPGGPALYESTLAPGLLDPANVVATGVTTPFDRAPPPATLLHYFIDDGLGSPALIFVTKGPLGLRFTF